MSMSLFALLSFAVITSFTPGPNNILCMTQGINGGLRSTFPYQTGLGIACTVLIGAGFFCGTGLAGHLPALLDALRYVGCAYMLYLAWCIFRAAPQQGDTADNRSATLRAGVIMQFVNPKFYLYVCTLTAVIAPLSLSALTLTGLALFFALIAVAGTMAWAVSGALLQNMLRRHYRMANTCMALALVYCALSLL